MSGSVTRGRMSVGPASDVARRVSDAAATATLPRRLLLGVFFGVSRLVVFLIPFGFFPYPDGRLLISDVTQYHGWAHVLSSGHFPIGDPTWQYPPDAGLIFWLGAHLTASPLVGFMALALAADVSIFCLLLRSGTRAATGATGLQAAWFYAIGGLAIGPVLLTRFDVFPTLLAVLALLALAKPVRSGVFMGIGALLKIWPALLVLAFPRRKFATGTAAMLATGVAGMTAAALYGPGFLSFLTQQRDRGLQIESVGGLIFRIGQLAGLESGLAFRYGALEIDAPAANAVGLTVSLVGLVAIGVVVFARFRGRLELLQGADVALTVVLISIATSRVFSPQYLVWGIGITAVCLLNNQTMMRPIAAPLLATAAMGQVVYPVAYQSLREGGWVGTLAQTFRIGLLLTATIWAVWLILRRETADKTAKEPVQEVSRRLGRFADNSGGSSGRSMRTP